MIGPLHFEQELSDLNLNEKKRHEELIDLFGHFIFWLRNTALRASRKLVECDESRRKLGTVRAKYYDDVAKMSTEDREAAILLAEQTINGFLERFLWCLGDEGTDARLGSRHAYRFRLEMEIVDLSSDVVVHSEPINRVDLDTALLADPAPTIDTSPIMASVSDARAEMGAWRALLQADAAEFATDLATAKAETLAQLSARAAAALRSRPWRNVLR